MSPLLLNVLIGLITIVTSSYTTVKLLQYRADRSEESGKEERTKFDESIKELRNFMIGINISMERQLIIQKMTTDTLSVLNNKIEATDDTVRTNTIEIALLKERERLKNGRS